MTAITPLAPALEKYTVENSNFDNSRPYISLSNILFDEQLLIAQFKQGYTATHEQKLKCYKGYQMEADLKKRIIAVFGSRIQTPVEIKCFNDLVQGHPDFTFDGFPGDCKSVLKDAWLPVDGVLPSKVYYQLQGYMLYMRKPAAVAVYESRENGKIIDIWIKENKTIQQDIDNKLIRIVNKILSGL